MDMTAEDFQAAIAARVAGGGRHVRVSDPRYQGLATEKGYVQHNGRIDKTRYSHEALIDQIIANPRSSQNDLAKHFGYSVSWISRIMGSDAFQAALAKRRDDITDPFLIATVEEKLRGLADQSINVIAQKLEATQNADLAIKTLDLATKALGFGARHESGRGGNITNTFVVAMPGKAPDSDQWAKKYIGTEIEAQQLSTTVTRDALVQPTPTQLAGNED